MCCRNVFFTVKFERFLRVSLYLSLFLLLANSGTQSSYLIRFLLLPLIRSVLANMYEMEEFLQKTEDINWTVVRPPGLKNLPASGIKADKQWPTGVLNKQTTYKQTHQHKIICLRIHFDIVQAH